MTTNIDITQRCTVLEAELAATKSQLVEAQLRAERAEALTVVVQNQLNSVQKQLAQQSELLQALSNRLEPRQEVSPIYNFLSDTVTKLSVCLRWPFTTHPIAD